MKSLQLLASASLALAALVGCGDDTTATGSGGSGGSGTGDSTTTSTSTSTSDSTSSTDATTSTGSGAVTAETVTAAQCAGLGDPALVIDGEAEPPLAIEVDTVYDIQLYQVDEPTQFLGFASLAIAEPGSYFMLVLDLANDSVADGGYISTPEGQPALAYSQCDGCFDVCEAVDSAFVYQLPTAGTYDLGFSSQEQESLRFIVARVD